MIGYRLLTYKLQVAIDRAILYVLVTTAVLLLTYSTLLIWTMIIGESPLARNESNVERLELERKHQHKIGGELWVE